MFVAIQIAYFTTVIGFFDVSKTFHHLIKKIEAYFLIVVTFILLLEGLFLIRKLKRKYYYAYNN